MKLNLFILICIVVMPFTAWAGDVATIANSGSTNINGYQVAVSPSGAVTGGTAASIPAPLAQKFFADLKALPRGDGLPHQCMKSASFGSRTIVTYQGKQTQDISCPNGPAQATLYRDVLDVVSAAGASTRPRHVMRLHQ